ncbi:DUF3172 domain-containing protein [Microcoleus sp. FACHB-53]|jgi:hypothetical protein|nr:DUF3172 domain-containing protein [Microcoleus sp. FACHB-53]MBD2128192.1 DUF3172 domain-containing protein [Microcoleus sp. FACHB-1]
MKRKSRFTPPNDRDSFSTSKPASSIFTPLVLFAFAAIFILGVGVGIAFSSTATFNPENVASREVIDRSVPNAELCVQYGASSIVTDMRVFVTLNPFNVFVTQPTMRPGCVLRQNNWSILEQKNLVTSDQVRDCKRRMNTFGFTGDLNSKPEIECIYQNEAAGNLFLNQPGSVGPKSETNNF